MQPSHTNAQPTPTPTPKSLALRNLAALEADLLQGAGLLRSLITTLPAGPTRQAFEAQLQVLDCHPRMVAHIRHLVESIAVTELLAPIPRIYVLKQKKKRRKPRRARKPRVAKPIPRVNKSVAAKRPAQHPQRHRVALRKKIRPITPSHS